MNSAFCKNRSGVQANSADGGVCVNSAFCKNKVGSSSRLCILGNESREFISILPFLKAQWGIPADSANKLPIFRLNSAFSDLNSREWRVCMNSAFFKNRVGSSTELCIFRKYIGEFKQTLHFLTTKRGVQTNSALRKSTVGLQTNFAF